MIATREMGDQTGYRHWSQAVMSLLVCQWNLFEAQYQGGLKLLQSVFGIPDRGPVAGAGTGMDEELRRLEGVAAERMRRGLAPPREIYELPYRDRVDWSQFPAWARPVDPELFEGCTHEG